MRGIESHRSVNISTPPAFMTRLPAERTIGTGIATSIITVAIRCFPTPKPFPTGFLYGGISGVINMALRHTQKKNNGEKNTPAVKIANVVINATLPWVVSTGIMQQTYKITGNVLFHISPAVALGSALIVESLAHLSTHTKA